MLCLDENWLTMKGIPSSIVYPCFCPLFIFTENVNGYLTLSNCAISHQMGFFQNLQLKTTPITHFFPTNYHEKNG